MKKVFGPAAGRDGGRRGREGEGRGYLDVMQIAWRFCVVSESQTGIKG